MSEQPFAELGERLRNLREGAGIYTQKDLLIQLQLRGVEIDHASTVSHWENGWYRPERPTFLVLLKFHMDRKALPRTYQDAEELFRLAGFGNPSPWEAEELGIPWPSPASAGPPAVAPAQQRPRVFTAEPLPPQGVFGREEVLQNLLALARSTPPKMADQPLVIQGGPGIGKTTLALAVAHSREMEELCPDGVLWTEIGPIADARQALEEWGDLLGVDLRPVLDPRMRTRRLRNALHDRSFLLVVDDVWEPQAARPLLVGGPACRTIITTRNREVPRDLTVEGRVVEAKVLSAKASLQLLASLAPEAVQAQPEQAKRLSEKLEFHPLGLTLAGRHLHSDKDVPDLQRRRMEELIERAEARLNLTQSEPRVGISDEGPVSLRAVLHLSVERLREEVQRRFALLAVFAAEPYSWTEQAAAAVWGCSLEEAEATLARLLLRGLIERWRKNYRMHALLHDYASYLRAEWGL